MAWQQVDPRFVSASRAGAETFWFRESGNEIGELFFWLDPAGRPIEIHLSHAEWPGGPEEMLEWRPGRGLRVGVVDSGEQVSDRGVRYKMAPLVRYFSRPNGQILARLLAYFDDRVAALQPDMGSLVGGLLRSEALRIIVRRLVHDVYNGADPAAADLFLSDDFVDHGAPFPGLPADFRRQRAALQAAFPNLRYAVDDLVVEVDRAAVALTARGTHRGPLAGRPATGREVAWREIQILRLHRGRIAERWTVWDRTGLLRQIDV